MKRWKVIWGGTSGTWQHPHHVVVFLVVVFLVAIYLLLGPGRLVLLKASRGIFFSQERMHRIELREDGFYPKELAIARGDVVTFATRLHKPFWPASDLHPTHGIYPEFDPARPIDFDKTWSFKFDKPGIWTFHNHLGSIDTGIVQVTSNGGLAQKLKLQKQGVNDCKSLRTNSEKVACWEKALLAVLNTAGISAAFDLYAKFYNEPHFAQNCHGYTHKIGEAAYLLYSQHKDFDVDAKVAYCSYGFFHGFIEAMFQHTGTLDQARDFCDYIDNKLKNQTSVLSACMHGIGHGVTDGGDPTAWGDVKALIEPGKVLCEKISKNYHERVVCGSGIFNALEGMYQDPKYKLRLDKSDPFWICRQQDKDYFRHACFDDFKDIVMVITNQDFAAATKIYESINEEEYDGPAMDNLATVAAYAILRQPSYDYAIDICHNLKPRLRAYCIAGLGAGFMTAGVPGKEYVKAIELCQSSRITQAERAACFQRVLRLVFLRYSPEIYWQACGLVDDKDKKDTFYCFI